jgi:hypothetical protein
LREWRTARSGWARSSDRTIEHDRESGEPAELARLRSDDAQRQGRQAVSDDGSVDQSDPDKRVLVIYEFSTKSKRYTGRTFKYAKDSSNFITGEDGNATNIFVTGDMTHVAGDRYIVIFSTSTTPTTSAVRSWVSLRASSVSHCSQLNR